MLINKILFEVENVGKPKLWIQCEEKIEKEHLIFTKILNKGQRVIYGVNTLVGHRDDQKMSSSMYKKFYKSIFKSHVLGGEPYYSNYEIRCIGYVKMYNLAAGGSGISPTLYRLLSDTVISQDFYPKVPKGNSYSCGDVIPGSHWTFELLNFLNLKKKYNLRPGELMALINGAFIHLGYAISSLKEIRRSTGLFIECSRSNLLAANANSSNLYNFYTSEKSNVNDVLNHMRECFLGNEQLFNKQDPVSMRALPRLLETTLGTIDDFLKELNYYIFKPSGNPLLDGQSKLVHSQGSFLLPSVTLKTSALIDTLLLLMWAGVNRTMHLLSGKVPGIPIDGRLNEYDLGLIQIPKLMMSILEESRHRYGNRVFSKGSSTSYGTEDLWSYGVIIVNDLKDLLIKFNKFFALEFYVNLYCIRHFRKEDYLDIDVTELLNYDNINQAIKFIITLVSEEKFKVAESFTNI